MGGREQASRSRRRNCRITYPTGITDTFAAEIQSFEPTVPVDDRMTATLTLKVTGVVARGMT